MALWSFDDVIKGVFMPLVSVPGLIGNFLSIFILHNKEVKLKKGFVEVLCSLAAYDNLLLICTFFLFTLPTLSQSFRLDLYPYAVGYLYPATNTFMTCSIYMTVAVAVNRYLDIGGTAGCQGWQLPRLNNGYTQAVVVFFFAAAINVPRWLELDFEESVHLVNVTDPNTGGTISVNQTAVEPVSTELRLNIDYIRDYTLITSTVLIVLLPTCIMLVSSVLIYREMVAATKTGVFSQEQESLRRQRNRNITIMLIGIIVLFLVCHIGEVFISVYELIDVLDGERSSFPRWASNTVTFNNFLVVVNSSLNFVIYCKDVLFRRCLMMLYRAWRGTSEVKSAAQQLRSINKELGISLQGDPCAEVVLRELDPQSKILCGISNV